MNFETINEIKYIINTEIIEKYGSKILEQIDNSFDSFYKNFFKFAILRFDFNENSIKVKNFLKEIKNNIHKLRDKKEIFNLIDKYLGVSEVEKKQLGEVFTPFALINEMLDTLPKEVWSNPNLKYLDPANGIGNFGAVVVERLMEGLKEWEQDEEKRYKHILENMLYVCDISPKNMFIYLNIFDPDNKYKMNYHRGSFLEKGFDDKMKEWGIENFDIVMGNFPYQEKVGAKKTQPLWNLFVKKSIILLNKNGYLVNVHPSGWRNVEGNYKDIQELLKNNLLYLEMHSDKDGQEIFGATTSYDWYCYSKSGVATTMVKDKNGIHKMKLSNMEFIPNGEFELFDKLIAKNDEEKIEILHSYSAYETRKEYMSKDKNQEFKYPCVYTITKDKTINLYWSNTNTNGHFNIPKVIWTNGMASPPTIDKNGDYGLTQFAYAIVDNISNLENIKKAMDSEKFINLMKLCYMSSGNRFERKVLSTFKKDFWKEFI